MKRSRVLLPLVAAACATLASARPAASPIGEPETVQSLLAELRDPDELVRLDARQRLSQLGPEALAPVLDVLYYRVACGEGCSVLPDEMEALLLERLTAWPSDRVAAGCLARARQGGLDDGLRSLQLFAGFARASEWGALLELCATLPEEERAHPLVTESLRKASVAMLQRDQGLLRVLERSLGRLEPWIEDAFAEALGESGLTGALPLLAQMLGRDAGLDVRILCALGGWPRWKRSYDECVDLVETYLRSPDADVRRASAATLGRMRAGRSLALLVYALEDRSSGVRRTALWSLRYATGIEFLSSPEEWRVWLEREEQWLDGSAPRLCRAVAEGSVNEALPAVVELGRHPWYAHLAEDLLEALGHEDAVVVKAACNALAELGGPLAFDGLLERCQDERADVRQAAQISFERLVGVSWEAADTLAG